jgi:hypothetical protein
VTAEPLRESAQRVLIEAHLAEGNLVEGRRTFAVYRDLLCSELGTEPPADLAAAVARGYPGRSGQVSMGDRRVQTLVWQ